MTNIKLCTCKIGLARLKRGVFFTAFAPDNDEHIEKDDVVILVHEDDIEPRNGLYTVLNKKPIKVI